LLLGATRSGNIDRLLHGAPAAGAGRLAATAWQQQGGQQQTPAVSRLQRSRHRRLNTDL